MCGRYASSRSREELVIEFEVEEDHLDEQQPSTGQPLYNVAPTDTVPVVLERAAHREPSSDRSEDEATKPGKSVLEDADALVTAALRNQDEDDRPVRQLRSLRWGLVPSWSKDASGGARMINARLETLLTKGAFKKAALSRRCLVPADGWYEWQVSPTAKDAKGKPRKQPFFIHLADGHKLALAGIYEFWRNDELAAEDPGAWLVTFAVITMAAEPGMDTIHDRMPLVLPDDRWADWLDPATKDEASVHDLTADLPTGRFAALPITTRVNSVRNDGPELLEPAAQDSLIGVVDPAAEVMEIETPLGPARAHLWTPKRAPVGRIVLGHGAGGGIGAADLVAVRKVAVAGGWQAVLVEQPWRVAGKKVAVAPPKLDIGWLAVFEGLTARPDWKRRRRVPLVVGGRSAGARVACRTAADLGARAVCCLAFPLHPPGRPEKSRADELAQPPEAGIGVLVVQGDKDPFGGWAEVEALGLPGIEVARVEGDHSLRKYGPVAEAVAAHLPDWAEPA